MPLRFTYLKHLAGSLNQQNRVYHSNHTGFCLRAKVQVLWSRPAHSRGRFFACTAYSAGLVFCLIIHIDDNHSGRCLPAFPDSCEHSYLNRLDDLSRPWSDRRHQHRATATTVCHTRTALTDSAATIDIVQSPVATAPQKHSSGVSKYSKYLETCFCCSTSLVAVVLSFWGQDLLSFKHSSTLAFFWTIHDYYVYCSQLSTRFGSCARKSSELRILAISSILPRGHRPPCSHPSLH